MPVPVDSHIKLIEQASLHLGQGSNSVLCSSRLGILKSLVKDPKKLGMSCRKEQIYYKKQPNIFGKKF